MTNQRFYVIPTNELRWKQVKGEEWCSPPTLQQKWMQYPLKDNVPQEHLATIQWRDVPFVEEESETENG